MNTLSATFSPYTRTIGKYRLCALAKGLDDGRWRASISIRSGHGSASTDRVLRLSDSFDNEHEAHRQALAQGMVWLAEAGRLQPPSDDGSNGGH